jgi:hypothetical protein
LRALVGGQPGGLSEHPERDQADGAVVEEIGDFAAKRAGIDTGGVVGERSGKHAPQPARQGFFHRAALFR